MQTKKESKLNVNLHPSTTTLNGSDIGTKKMIVIIMKVLHQSSAII